MSDTDEKKKKWYMPKYYYWAKNPPKLNLPPKNPNPQQKKFYRIMLALRIARVAAVALILTLLFLRW